jgi:hypothetical protein
VLLAEGLHVRLAEVRVLLDLVDRRDHRSAIEERFQVLDHEVADADGADLAVGQERLQGAVAASPCSRSRRSRSSSRRTPRAGRPRRRRSPRRPRARCRTRRRCRCAGSRRDLVEDALHGGADLLLHRARALGRGGIPGAREVEQVRALGVVQLKRASESFEHELGGAADVPAFQALVVLEAHARQRRDLLAAQPGHAPLAVGGQTGLLGRDPRPAGGQELGDVVGGVHGVGLPSICFRYDG